MESEVLEAYKRLATAFREGRWDDKFACFAEDATGRWLALVQFVGRVPRGVEPMDGRAGRLAGFFVGRYSRDETPDARPRGRPDTLHRQP